MFSNTSAKYKQKNVCVCMCMWKQKERNGRRAREIEGGGKDREREIKYSKMLKNDESSWQLYDVHCTIISTLHEFILYSG